MLTIHTLVEEKEFALRFAGEPVGLHRPVTWVHVVDLADPWNWVERGTLILTTGYWLPPDEEQETWLERIIEAGASGVVIAPQDPARVLASSALTLAQTRNFPVLIASFELKFSNLARFIVNHTVTLEQGRNHQVQRIYDTYAASVHTVRESCDRLKHLERVLGVSIHLADAHGYAVLPGKALNSPPSVPSARVVLGEREEEFFLTIMTAEGGSPGARMLSHLTTVVTLELQLAVQQAQEWQNSQDQRLSQTFNDAVIDGVQYVCFVRHDETEGDVSVLLRTFFNTLPLSRLFAHTTQNSIGTTDDPDSFTAAVSNTFPRARIGLSAPITHENTLSEGIQQAREAAGFAHPGTVNSYDAAAMTHGVVPASPATRQQFVREYIAPIQQHDSRHHTRLLETLRTFLHEERSIKTTAHLLGVHRHTVNHRLRTIETLTGVDPTSTAGIATFWVALESQGSTA